MSIDIYTEKEKEILRESGRRLSSVLKQVSKEVKQGITVDSLNALSEKLIKEMGDIPAFLNYQPEGANRPYPASLCVSINDEIVHGVSKGNKRLLKEGDIVGLDLGIIHKGLVTDMAITVGVGQIDKKAQELIDTTKQALYAGIDAARAGNKLGDISHAIEKASQKSKYGITRELGGHGVGHKVHQEPYISNIGEPGKGIELKSGMVLALEPMLAEGSQYVILDEDGYTFKTADGSRSAHFEHTILITEGEAEILTKM
jgi:methionyl aminopeptidase